MSVNNSVKIIGNIGQDPELNTSGSGTSVLNLSVAVDRTYRRTDPNTGVVEKVKTVDWVPVTCWGSLAENCARYLQKGSQIAVEGQLRRRDFTGRDGREHRVMEVRADEVQFLSRVRSSNDTATVADNS